MVRIENAYFAIAVPDVFSVNIPARQPTCELKKGSTHVVFTPINHECYQSLIAGSRAPLPEPDRQTREINRRRTGVNDVVQVCGELRTPEGKVAGAECDFLVSSDVGYCHVLVCSGVGARGFKSVLALVDTIIDSLRILGGSGKRDITD